MFFDDARIVAVREMIVAADADGRRAALAKLLPAQRADFAALFRIMAGLPVTIRLLDPPLHEFLPRADAEIASVAQAAGVTFEALRSRIAQLHEINPMLGHRGCRLGISYPEIYEMQARAIFRGGGRSRGRAAGRARDHDPAGGVPARARHPQGRHRARPRCGGAGNRVRHRPFHRHHDRAAAGRAHGRRDRRERCEFFSFGTNDLTQTALGISRDDAASFIGDYERAGILARDPFASLDREGVGELVQIAAERGRAARADLKLGICGEHGGDPASIDFFEEVGLDYVSCSPYRVPVARLAAAQAAIAHGEGGGPVRESREE